MKIVIKEIINGKETHIKSIFDVKNDDNFTTTAVFNNILHSSFDTRNLQGSSGSVLEDILEPVHEAATRILK